MSGTTFVAEYGDRIRQNMMALVQSFPSLKRDAVYYRKNGPSFEFDARKLNCWARSAAVTSGSLHAALFILSVWDPSHRWTAGRFNVCRAFQVWDEPHCDAFRAWAARPWFP